MRENNIIYFPGCEPEEVKKEKVVSFVPECGGTGVALSISSTETSPFDVSVSVPMHDGSLTSKLKEIVMNMFIHILFGADEQADAEETMNRLMSSYNSPDEMALDLAGVSAKELFESAGIEIK